MAYRRHADAGPPAYVIMFHPNVNGILMLAANDASSQLRIITCLALNAPFTMTANYSSGANQVARPACTALQVIKPKPAAAGFGYQAMA